VLVIVSKEISFLNTFPLDVCVLLSNESKYHRSFPSCKINFFKKAHQIEKISRRFLMNEKANIFSMKKQKKKKMKFILFFFEC
jgi:hypothetical protein